MSFQPRILGGDMSRSPSDGFEQIETLKGNIKQNLKMLLLTNPGERVMDPNFGVGISRYLFEMVEDQTVYADIDSKIREQISLYLPYIKIQRVDFLSQNNNNKINLKITYSVPKISLNDQLVTEVL
jgi:phage baseplate assembly protein W|tara:strand:- start:399 stop:776 length:378 start_codon:yes stop_codon:yes gene_type:complete